MQNLETNNERTPLLRHSSEEGLSGFDRVQRDFNEALEEEAPGTTFFDLLVKRPASVMVALSLFALLLLAVTSIESLKSPEFTNMAMRAVEINPIYMQVTGIRNHEIDVKTETEFKLDYSQLGNDSYLSTFAKVLGDKLSFVTLSLDGPMTVYTKLESSETDNWKYIISARVAEQFEMKLEDGMVQSFAVAASVSDVGRSDVLGEMVKKSLKNQPIEVMAEGTAIVSKYGLSFRVPFQYSRNFSIPKQTTDEFAEISKVSVEGAGANSLKLTALANATVGEFPISAKLPEFSWRVKIPGCEDRHRRVSNLDVCKGESLPFEVVHGDADLNIFFQSTVDEIPEQLMITCGAPFFKSPLDRFIESYLAGKLTTFYVEGLRDESQPAILNDLLCGYDIPYTVFGKAATEKLIRSVKLEEVRFGNQFGQLDQNSISFSGRALVDVVLPRFMELKEKSAIFVTGVRGTIQLFDSNFKHFGQIQAYKNKQGEIDESFWLQTISLVNGEGYKISCFFDDLPMEVTDREALAGVSREILLRGHAAISYDAVVDVRVNTMIGEFVTRRVRIKGKTEMYA